jgi:outer membrane protein assembly factor BamE
MNIYLPFKFLHSTLLRLFGVIVCAALASACQSNNKASGFFEPYRVDVPQGNYVTKEMLAQLKTGMSTQQVKFVMGAPLLTPVFSADRWDYVFRHQFADGSYELQRVVIRFKDGKVGTIEADDLPSAELKKG